MRLALEPSLRTDAYPFAHRLRVRFAETDAMGIAHHASYLPWLEEARVRYLDAIGHPYLAVRENGVDFAVLEVHTSYLRPLRFDDAVDVHVLLGAATRTTFQLAYLLAIDGTPHATAVTVHGAVRADGRPTRLPSWIAGA